MKKFWQLVLVAMFALVLVGCTGGNGGQTGPTGPIGGTEECEHTFEDHICTKCGAIEEGNIGPEDLPPFKEGESCAEDPDHERCGYIEHWTWNYNRT